MLASIRSTPPFSEEGLDGGTNVGFKLKFRPFISSQLDFRPFVSYQLNEC